MAEDHQHDLTSILARYRIDVEALLRDSIPSDPVVGDMYQMLRYHLGWIDANFDPVRQRGGKHIRPVLCLLSCEAVGGDARRALPAAAAVELFHNFSLVHDDVEDRSDQRRGRPTVRAIWGDGLAVNAGDAMLVLSQLALLRATSHGVDPSLLLTLIRVMNRAFLAVAEGQHLDLTLEGNPDITREQYEAIVRRKTAALIGAAAQMGALSGGARPERAEHFHRFGAALGVAFQIQDDILGIWGDPTEVGKGEAGDVYGRKVTLPVIVAIERAGPKVATRIRQVYSSATITRDEVDEIVRLLSDLGGREAAEVEVQREVALATEELEKAQPEAGPARDLWVVAQSLIGRTF